MRAREKGRCFTLVRKQHRREYSAGYKALLKLTLLAGFQGRTDRRFAFPPNISSYELERLRQTYEHGISFTPRSRTNTYVCICISQPQDIEAWITRPNSKDVAATGCGGGLIAAC